MKTLIAVTSALFITVACQKKTQPSVTLQAPTTTAGEVTQPQPCEDTTTVGDTEKSKEVECED
jgi:hypothetical protein